MSWAKGGVIASVDYTLDAAGNRTPRVDGLGTHVYDYDDLYRITNADYPARTTTLTPTTPLAIGSRRLESRAGMFTTRLTE